MKQNKQLIQPAIIGLSAFIIVASSILFLKGAGDFLATNVVDSNLSREIEKVATPVNYETRIAKGDALFKSGFYSLATNEYAFAVKIQFDNPEAHIKLGNSYLALKDFNKAIAEYKSILERNADNLEAKILYGKALIKNKNFKDAQSIFDSFTAEIQEAKYYGALLDSLSGRFADAEKKLKRANELEGEIPKENISMLLSVYATFDKQKEGHEVYLKTLLAKAMVDLEEYQLAEALTLDVLGIKNDYRDAWIILGYSKLKTEEFKDAEDAFLQAKKLDAIKPETHYFLASSLYSQEKYMDAVKEYELALLYGFQPEAEAYKKIAESHLFLNDYENALSAYEHLVKIDSSDVDLFVKPVWIAITYVKDLDRALSISKDATVKFPNEAMSHNLLGWTYLEMDQLDNAKLELSRSILLDTTLPEAHYNSGLLNEKLGNSKEAGWEFKKAYDLSETEDPINKMAAEKYNQILTDDTTS